MPQKAALDFPFDKTKTSWVLIMISEQPAAALS